MNRFVVCSLTALALALAGCGKSTPPPPKPDDASAGADRTDIRVVGSSTIYPFAIKVRDAFQASGAANQVLIESTGTGAGQEAFCQSASMDTPDIVNSSRAQSAEELALCKKDGVNDVIEVKFGFDGIVIAHSKGAKPTQFSLYDFYLALAKDLPTDQYDCTMAPNPNKKWSDINPELPDAPILVYGPPSTSGTRDVFEQIVMEKGAKRFACLDAKSGEDYAAFSALVHPIRDDGAWVDSGENDEEIVKSIDKNHSAFGIFGHAFLTEHADIIEPALISGVGPTAENIASGKYRLSRPLYFYIKKSHFARLPAIKTYALEFLSENAAGEAGYLKAIGLVPLAPSERAAYRKTIEDETTMQGKPAPTKPGSTASRDARGG